MFPNFPNKHLEKAIFTPADFLAYLKQVDRFPKFPVPKAAIFSYQKSLIDHVVENHRTSKMETTLGEMYLLDEADNQIGLVGKLGIGAPAVVTALEELIAWGVTKFISIGTAGGLQKSLKIGDIVVCDKAIRDEGVSHHYLAAAKYAAASSLMVEKIKASLTKQKTPFLMGTSWTIDAPYRETVAEALQYQNEGVLTVEMEAAALFSVATFRNIPLGAIFTISDSLADLKWQPQFHKEETQEGLEKLYQVALEVLIN